MKDMMKKKGMGEDIKFLPKDQFDANVQVGDEVEVGTMATVKAINGNKVSVSLGELKVGVANQADSAIREMGAVGGIGMGEAE